MRTTLRIACLLPLLFALAAPAVASEPSSLSRGGRLYDNWYHELGEKPPAQRHAAYPVAGPAAAEPARTWRCVECHGWDYRGSRGLGVKGVTAMAGAPPERVLAVLTDPLHGYNEVMDRQDLQDLAAFVARGQSPLMARIGRDGSVDADPLPAIGLYQTVCALCHGADGQAMQSMPPLGDLAREDPWRTLHDVVNGHAGGAMPSLRVLDDGLILATLAHLQTLPAREMQASLARGGRLYGNWAAETGRQPPPGAHPSWRGKPADATEARGTWKCRECHGWDYLGKDGAYGSGRHFTGIAGIRGAAGRDPAEIAALLADETHRFAGLLSRRDLLDLARFVSAGQTDVYRLIDRASGKIAGDAPAYAAHYDTLCATCHGADGRRVRTMPPLGRVVQEEPARALHSVLNGHPGENMPPLRAFPDEMVAGILAHAQGLPTRK